MPLLFLIARKAILAVLKGSLSGQFFQYQNCCVRLFRHGNKVKSLCIGQSIRIHCIKRSVGFLPVVSVFYRQVLGLKLIGRLFVLVSFLVSRLSELKKGLSRFIEFVKEKMGL